VGLCGTNGLPAAFRKQGRTLGYRGSLSQEIRGFGELQDTTNLDVAFPGANYLRAQDAVPRPRAKGLLAAAPG
jgi:hypothetical protein